MSIDLKRGDVVECIDNTPDEFDPKAALLKKGRVYRVAVAGISKERWCVGFRCLPSSEPGKAWAFCARRFRKLRAADDEFVELVRAPRRTAAKVSA